MTRRHSQRPSYPPWPKRTASCPECGATIDEEEHAQKPIRRTGGLMPTPGVRYDDEPMWWICPGCNERWLPGKLEFNTEFDFGECEKQKDTAWETLRQRVSDMCEETQKDYSEGAVITGTWDGGLAGAVSALTWVLKEMERIASKSTEASPLVLVSETSREDPSEAKDREKPTESLRDTLLTTPGEHGAQIQALFKRVQSLEVRVGYLITQSRDPREQGYRKR